MTQDIILVVSVNTGGSTLYIETSLKSPVHTSKTAEDEDSNKGSLQVKYSTVNNTYDTLSSTNSCYYCVQ